MTIRLTHPSHRVVAFERAAPHTLRVEFDDGTVQVIDFTPVLEGATFEPLNDERLFDQVALDPETHTLVWPNGADFDPATLHDWPKYADEMKRMARAWGKAQLTTPVQQ